MSPTVAVRGATTRTLPFDTTAWKTWLGEQIDADWRPAEWNHDLWLFTGDLESPWTAAWPCRIPTCVIAVRSSNTLCAACRSA
jgi:hypothetical protein